VIKPADIPRLYNQHGSLKAIHRAYKDTISWHKVRKAYADAVKQGLMPELPIGPRSHATLKLALPKQRAKRLKTHSLRHKRYILTCAQNNTEVHAKTWVNLMALAKHYDARVMVSTFLYARRSHWQANLDKNAPDLRNREIWFDNAIVPYISNDRVEIAPGLVWCGELNIIPTAERPLSGLEVYTGRASMIVPHTHVQMQSIATIGGDGTKFNYTTGTVTLRNYIQRKEGFKSEFHHVYGALLVEVDDEGHWWVRQLCADSDGAIYDLDVLASDGTVTTGHRVEAITFGDVHVAEIDVSVEKGTWGTGGMVDQLRPRHQIIHDVFDMYARGYHEIKNPYSQLLHFVEGKDSVAAEVFEVREFLKFIAREDCETVVVNSNHDRFLWHWLNDKNARHDPVNAAYWSELNHLAMAYIAKNKKKPELLALALGDVPARMLGQDESFVVCPDIGGGIECGLHGDLGPNGARGALRAFGKMGRRSNIGHSHVAGIDGGAWQAGTNSMLQLDYNHGPSAWSHSDIIVYPNSKRAIITFFKGKWKA
jgi:hypothetical protein